MSVDYDDLLKRLEGASRGRRPADPEPDDDYDPFASPPPTAGALLSTVPRLAPGGGDTGPFPTPSPDAWAMPTGASMWGGPMNSPAMNLPSPTQYGALPYVDHTPASKLRTAQGPPSVGAQALSSPLTAHRGNHSHLPWVLNSPHSHNQHLPSVQVSPHPPLRGVDADPGDVIMPNPLARSQAEAVAPAIAINYQHATSAKAKIATSADGDYSDDDGWIDSAIAEMNDVQAAGKPEAPERRTSPYFLTSPSETQPAAPKQAHLLPPSRTPSAAKVRFPKLGPSPVEARPTPSPVSLATPVVMPDQTGPSRPIKKGHPRVSVYALESPAERALFTFKEFNEMQSVVFHTAYKTDENIVVSAPTGSGKTTVFELAFLRMLQFKSGSFTPLAIYMAPTKALCSERVNDWRERFKRLNVMCTELTGDTEVYNIHKYTENVDLIVTTPEKWDSVTRRTYMSRIQSRLCLMMIDEVHTLNEERGATLEVVVSRMKKRGDALRFVAVSATVPNIDDVARWLGRRHGGKNSAQEDRGDDEDEPAPPPEYDDINEIPRAHVFRFGDEFRPVPLKLHAMGSDAPNEFALGSKLDKELFPVLNRYSDSLPTLVFCPTRKACQMTAEHIYKEYQNALNNQTRLPWDPSENKKIILKDAKIQKWTELGIAVHHAGLDILDRRNIEQAFRNSQLHLIVATSTLAVGVNLPAHLVVIKGTSCWAGQGFREYTDIDIQQMMGRAGRPQYDTSGTVVIMCNKSKLHKYQSMMNSQTILESCLHQHLTEHINSEIGLGTIGSLKNAQDWLRGTFLSMRIRQNPKYYQGTVIKDHSKSWDVTLDRFVENAVLDLEKHDFVTDDEETIKEQTEEGETVKEIMPTSLGKVMSQNFISYKTMCHIITMDANSGMREVLEILAGSTEFSSLRIRQGEGALLNKLRVRPDIRFGLDQAKTYADKVFLLLQVAFGNVSLDEFSTKTENTSPLQTQVAIFNAAPRIARAIFAVACHKKYGGAALAALELCHTVNGKAWEDSPTIFRQIDRIGPKSITVLASNGIASFDDFIKLDSGRLEMWLNRHPPFGYEVIERAKEFPRFTIEFFEEDVGQDENGFPTIQLRLQIKNTGQLVQKPAKGGGIRGNQNRRKATYTLIILMLSTKDNRFLDCRSINTAKLNDRVREFPIEVTLYDPEETIVCVAGVEEKSGLSRTFEYKPNIPARQFPKRKDLVARINGTDAEAEGSESANNNVDAPRRPGSLLFLSSEDSDIETLSDDDELIDLTAPQSRKGKKRSRDSKGKGKTPAPNPKKRKLALAVKSFIDDEAIDDDEDDEEASLDDVEGFIDDSEPVSRASGSRTTVKRAENSTSKGKSKTNGETRTSARVVAAENKKAKSTRAHVPDPNRPRLEDIPGYSATLHQPPVLAAPEPKQDSDDLFAEWFGEFME